MSTVPQPLTVRDFWRQRQTVGYAPPWTTLVNIPSGAILAYIAYRVGLRPNHVTGLSLVISTVAAVGYYVLPQDWISTFLLLCLLQLGYALDCADGQLARVTKRTSEFGRWLDIAIDLANCLILPLVLVCFGIAKSGVPTWIFIVLGALLAYSRALSLVTASLKRETGTTQSKVSWLRHVYRLACDTGTFLFVIAPARMMPTSLPLLMVGFCLLYCTGALHMAKTLAPVSKS